ncbi:uncharacterized protein NPIL_602111 [Nephila pilipes]|uniref:Uncharacterized protein n=1 Tax=Nephila pilipes TaxID=299642 RepID=A0A8X6TJE3_NEPPI|nr:uncharacterized protein NPIL_602111 [Nephila pilipes]
MYQQQYPRRRCPHHSTFAMIDRLLRKTGTFHSARSEAGRPRNILIPQMKETMQQFTDSPSISTRAVADELDVPHTVVLNVLHTTKIYPFLIRRYNF